MTSNPLRARVLAATFLLLSAGSARASTRLEIVDDMLWDHQSGLVWQHVEATLGLTLPTDARVGEWRVATGNELVDLLGHPFDEIVARDSDRYFALSYFSSGKPCGDVAYEGCFGGWWHDAASARPGDPAYYNVAGFSWKSIAGDPGHVLLSGGVSLGSYTEERCGIFCDTPRRMYTVQSIPEPTSILLIASGLVGLARRGSDRSSPGSSSAPY